MYALEYALCSVLYSIGALVTDGIFLNATRKCKLYFTKATLRLFISEQEFKATFPVMQSDQ